MIQPPRVQTIVQVHSSSRSFESQVSTDDAGQKAWRRMILPIWEDIVNHRHGPVFKTLMKLETAPGYYEAIRCPLDLQMIRQRIRDGTIRSTSEFHRDLLLMVTNAFMYNKEGTAMNRYAQEMKTFIEEKMRAHRNTEHLIRRKSVQGLSPDFIFFLKILISSSTCL